MVPWVARVVCLSCLARTVERTTSSLTRRWVGAALLASPALKASCHNHVDSIVCLYLELHIAHRSGFWMPHYASRDLEGFFMGSPTRKVRASGLFMGEGRWLCVWPPPHV